MRYFRRHLNNIWFFLWIFIFVGMLFAFNRYQGLRVRNENLGKEIENVKIENQELASEVYRLKSDPDYARKRAEQKLGFAEKGEIIYKIIPDGEGRR